MLSQENTMLQFIYVCKLFSRGFQSPYIQQRERERDITSCQPTRLIRCNNYSKYTHADIIVIVTSYYTF